MQVVILAGGLGTRLRAVAGDKPKSLVEVAGRPFIDYQLELLAAHHLRDIVICAGYGADQIEAYLSGGGDSGVSVRYSREDPEALLGTGGALVHALPLLDDAFFVLYGDSYLDTDYTAAVKAFEACGFEAMMCVFRNEGRWDHSNVRVSDDRVTFYSKHVPPGEADFIDYGLSAFRRAVIESYQDAPMPLDLAAVQRDLVGRDALAAFVVKERFYEVGKPEGLAELEAHLQDGGGKKGDVHA